MKSIFQSRTFWVAVGQAVAGVLVAAFAVNPQLHDVGWIAVVKSAVDIWLRLNSTTQTKLSV